MSQEIQVKQREAHAEFNNADELSIGPEAAINDESLQDATIDPISPSPTASDRVHTEAVALRVNVEEYLEVCRSASTLTVDYASSLVALPGGHSTNEMSERHNETEDLRKKMRSSQLEAETLQAQINHLQSETARLRSQLEDQSAFCASLGAVLGNLVWKASRVPPVVDILLSGNKLADFLCIVSGTLDSFLETFHTVMPGPTADESQFIMAMGGIVTNMAAAPAGRQYLVNDPNGRDLIQHIIRVIPAIPTPSGNCLKRLLVMALYNVSINQAGLCLLHEENGGAIFGVVANCLQMQSTNELRLMALRLLLSLTCDLTDINVLNTVLKSVPRELIASMAQQGDANVQATAQEVMENLNLAQERIEQGSQRNKQFRSTNQPTSISGYQEMSATGGYDQTPVNRAAWKLPKDCQTRVN